MSAESETVNNNGEDTSMTSSPEKGKGKAVEQPDLSMAEEESSDEDSAAENQVRSRPTSPSGCGVANSIPFTAGIRR